MSRGHANRGKLWERSLDLMHGLYSNQRDERGALVVVIRNHPEVSVRRKGRAIVGAVYRKKGAPDYTLMTREGVIVADAKHTQKSRWGLGLLEDHQARTLSAVDEVGGLSLLLIEADGARWAIPWADVRPLWERWHAGDAKHGEASLTRAQMTTMSISASVAGRALNYLGAARSLLAQRRSGASNV